MYATKPPASRQAERSAGTRARLERAARDLFERRGFDAVSAEEIVTQARVTRGALYHHYDGKEGLFEAVVEGAMRRLKDSIARAAAGAPDARTALQRGVRRFLELGAAPRTQRLLFLDAPLVLGWQRWRQMDERYGLGLLRQALDLGIAQGQLRPQPTSVAAHLLLGAMIEAALWIARARHRTQTRAQARAEAERALEQLLDGLATPSGQRGLLS
jgi:AcrR family transcriptional regulator